MAFDEFAFYARQGFETEVARGGVAGRPGPAPGAAQTVRISFSLAARWASILAMY